MFDELNHHVLMIIIIRVDSPFDGNDREKSGNALSEGRLYGASIRNNLVR